MKNYVGRNVFIIIFLSLLITAFACGDASAAEKLAPVGSKQGPEIFVQTGHSAGITSLVVMPDQKHFLSGSPDKSIKLWEMDTGREVRTYNIKVPFDNIVISPDGTYALLNTGNELKLWDIGKGEVKKTLKGHTGKIIKASISSDSKYILSSSIDDKSVKIWESATGRELRSFNNLYAFALAFSPDGNYAAFGKNVLSALGGEGSTEIFEIATGKKVGTFSCADIMCWDREVIFSLDGKRILTASEILKRGSGKSDYVLRLFDINTGKEIKIFRGHTESIGAVAFSNDGRLIITADDQTLKQWDVSTGALVRSIPVKNQVFSFAFTSDGKNVLSGSWDIKLRDALDLKEVKSYGGDAESYESAALSPDGQRAVLGGFKVVKLLDINSGREVKTITGQGSSITSVLFSPDGKYAFSGGWNRYDFMNFSNPTHGEQYHAIKIWDVSTGAMVKALTGHTRRVSSCAISADGRYLVSGSEDNTIKLWDLPTGREIKTYVNGPLDKGRITDVAFLSGGRQILSSAWVYEDKGHNVTRVWNVSDDTELRRYSKSVGAVSQDGRYALSFSKEGAELCEALTGKKVKDLHGHEEFDCFSAAFSHSGRHIICGSGRKDGMLKLWDVPTGQWRTFSGHLNRVSAVSFSADDRLVISSSDDHTTRIWDAATGKEVVQYISFTDGEWIIITPGGYYNSSPNGDKHLNVRVGDKVYGIENYREAFFRPDLVKLALSGGSLKDFKTLADVKQPPSVSIVVTPKSTNKNEATVTLKIVDIGGGVGDVRLYLNGSAVVLDSSRGLKIVPANKKEALKTYTLKLTNGINTIRAIAFNGDNTMQSNDVLHEITASFKSLTKPTLNAIIVGINEYKNPKLQLQYAVSDAELFASTLKNVTAGLFEKVNIKKLVTKENTTNENIIKELKAYSALNPDDVFVFFVASHGVVDEGEYFLITSNVGSTRTEKLKTDALSQGMLKELIANIPTTKKLILIDTCNAGALGDAIQVAMLTRGMSEDSAMKILSRAVGSTILSASTSLQEAAEGYQGHGLFTYVLVEGLNGKADKGKSGYVKTTELADYVDNEVPALAEKIFKKAQYPTISISGQTFPIGKVR